MKKISVASKVVVVLIGLTTVYQVQSDDTPTMTLKVKLTVCGLELRHFQPGFAKKYGYNTKSTRIHVRGSCY